MSGLVPLPSVPVWGFAAVLVARAVRASLASGEFDGLHPNDRARLVRLVEDLGAAEAAWLEYRDGRTETPRVQLEQRKGRTEVVASQTVTPSEPMDVGTTAAVLGVSARRVRQLCAAGGLGAHRKGGRWLLDRALVLGEAERRRSA